MARTLKMGFEKNKRFAKSYNNIRQTVQYAGKNKPCHFRSKAERKVADYLECLKMGRQEKDWAYEQTTFHFKNIILKSYLVDFDVLRNDGTFYYIEVKGYIEKHDIDRLTVLFSERPEVELWMVFSKEKDKAKFLRKKISRQCKRVCTVAELCKGIF